MNKFIKERADESICKDHQPGKKAIMLKLIFVCSDEISEKIVFFYVCSQRKKKQM